MAAVLESEVPWKEKHVPLDEGTRKRYPTKHTHSRVLLELYDLQYSYVEKVMIVLLNVLLAVDFRHFYFNLEGRRLNSWGLGRVSWGGRHGPLFKTEV